MYVEQLVQFMLIIIKCFVHYLQKRRLLFLRIFFVPKIKQKLKNA